MDVPVATTIQFITSLDIGSLTSDANVLNFRYRDTRGHFSPIITGFFLKTPDLSTVGLSNKLTAYKYWFDSDIAHAVRVNLPANVKTTFLDAIPMPEMMPGGNHTMNIQYQDSLKMSSVPLYKPFFKQYDPRGIVTADNVTSCNGTQVTFTTQKTVDVDSVYWNFGDATSILKKKINESVAHAYSSAGTYTVTATFKHLASGKTGTATKSVTIYPTFSPNVSKSICPSETPYVFGTQNLTQSGTYTEVFKTIHGCDSTVTLNLTVKPNITNSITQSACDSYIWAGTTYTNSGSYVKTFPAANGCDSTVTMNLTVKHSVTNRVTQSACDSYAWAGTVYTSSGSYVKTFPAANGCDSTVTLNLTITKIINTITVNSNKLTADETDAAYQWYKNTILIDGATGRSYTVTEDGKYSVLITKNGCTKTSPEIEVIISAINATWANENVKVYPNPTNQWINIDFTDTFRNVEISVYNAIGLLISRQTFDNCKKASLRLAGEAGIYLIKVKSKNNADAYIKVIKK